MKKNVKLMSLLFTLVLICCCSIVTVNAQSTANAKAHKVLHRQLKADKERYFSHNSYKMRYAYADINGDHIDELITEPNYRGLTQTIYAYKNNSIKNIASVEYGYFTKYYPKHKVIYIKNSGHMGHLFDCYYKQTSNGTYKLVALAGRYYGNFSQGSKPLRTSYYINNKETTKAKYSKYVKKLVKSEKGKSFSSLKWKKY